jgi:catechol 2,3-dioxygenase-like lactoylglutathione lyase family enzyme
VPVIKVAELAYGRLQSPDLDVAEQFLTDFGLVRVERTPKALYMRGTDPAHHVHITELGEPRYLSIAWRATSYEDLERIAKIEGASGIESMDEPGGGKRVRLRDPDGIQIEIVHGIEALPELPIRRPELNVGPDWQRRRGELFRVPSGPSYVKRIAHVAIMTPDLRRMVTWYREKLGFLCSDEVYRGEQTNIVSSFNRVDRGQEYVDHHALNVVLGDRAGLNHLSFEVHDYDDVFTGHEYLERKGYRPTWGIGRHQLGSQVFDYWFDPWDRVHEHWTDTDLLNADARPGLNLAGVETRGPWGPYPPTNGFSTHVSR